VPWTWTWTDEDLRAVLLNIAASVALIVVADGLLRGLLSMVLGRAPRLRIRPAGDQRLRDLDWLHVRVTNDGLPLAPRTRAARAVIVSGKLDGARLGLLWATTADRPPEQVDIYRGHARLVPVVVRTRADAAADPYSNDMQPRVAYVTDAEFLTQGYLGKPASRPLTNGQHSLELTVQAEDGTTTSERFTIVVPIWPGIITIANEQRRRARQAL
jgi:hypothetical protein